MWDEWTEVCNPEKSCSDDYICLNTVGSVDDENDSSSFVGYFCLPPEICEENPDKFTYYLDEKNYYSYWCKTEDLNLVAPGTTDYNFMEQIGLVNGAS